jgi:3-methyladenine DNA glycosylase/8-oxoguanine DNA glycosylase
MTEIAPLPFDHVHAHSHLSQLDKRLARLIERIGKFEFQLDTCDSVYESLLEAIVHQSISGKAAAKIFSRIKALGSNRVCPTPQEILATPDNALREAGLSYAKAAAMKDLAQKTIDGIVPTLDQAHTLSDEDLVQRLISVKGIGAWTVEMFLIFRLGRPDVLPIHDYGVQKGFALTYGKKFMPKPRELAAFGERWRPYRSVASWYMWRAVGLYPKKKIAKAPTKKKKKPKNNLTKNNPKKRTAKTKSPRKAQQKHPKTKRPKR